MKLLPSIASADPIRIEDEINGISAWPELHIDIEDGNFLPNITFGMKTVRAITAAAAGRSIDVHLLVTNPLDYIAPLADLGISSICAHVEALPYPMQFLNRANSEGMRAGLALNMSTPIDAIEPFLPVMDYCLLMTAEPDALGDKLYAPALQRALRFAARGDVPLVADGGLNEEALRQLADAGAHAAVLGRLVFKADDPLAKLRELDALLNNIKK